MTFNSPIVVRQLQTLERQLAEVPRRHEALRTAWARCDPQGARRATVQAEHHVRAMAITTQQLKARVVPFDDLGDALESLSELALRATRRVVIAELDTLRALVQTRPKVAMTRPPSWGRFRGIEDLTVCVRAELDRITEPWLALRGRARSERPAYRVALHRAHGALRRLGTASEFGRFLWEGRRRTDWPALCALCIRISAVLTLRLDVAPDLPLVVCDQLGSERGHGAGGWIPENATCSPDGVREQPAARIDAFEAAIADVAACTRRLRSAITEVAFADAARLRDALAHVLSRTEALAARLPAGMARAAALHRLGALRGVAHDLLQIAPPPSAAAIAAMEAGDRTPWNREEQGSDDPSARTRTSR